MLKCTGLGLGKDQNIFVPALQPLSHARRKITLSKTSRLMFEPLPRLTVPDPLFLVMQGRARQVAEIIK